MTGPIVSGSGEVLAFDLVVRDKGATRGMRGFGDEVAKTGKKTDKTAADMAGLTAEIDRTTLRITELREELAKTGDRGLLKDLGKEQRALAQLQKIRKEVKGLADDSKEGLTGIGGLIGAGFSSLPPQAQAAVAGSIAAAIAAGAPLIGAAAASAILTGLAGGGLATGIAAAVQDHRVAAAFQPLADDAKDLFADIGEFFKRPLVGAVAPLRAAVAGIRADLILAAADTADLVEPLAKGIRGFIEAALGGGGFLKAVRAAGPVVEELAEQLPKIGAAVDDMFDSFASAGPGAVEGMRLLGAIIAGTVIFVGELVEFLSKTFDLMTDIAAKAPVVFGPLGILLATVNTEAGKVGETGAKSFHDIELGAGKAADEVKKLNDEFNTLISRQLSLDQSILAAEKSMLTLKGDLKEIGDSTDSNAVKQNAFKDRLLESLDAYNRVREQAIEHGGNTEEAAAKANAAFDKEIAKIRKMALEAGISAKTVDALLRPYLALLHAPNITKTITIKGKVVYSTSGQVPSIGVGQYGAMREGGVHYAQTGLLALSGQARTFASGTQPLFGFAEPGTGAEAFIARNAPRSRSLAIGAEAMRWHGATVVPNEAGGQGVRTIRLVFESGGGDRLLQEIVRQIRGVVDNEGGGNVQLALGR